MTSDTIHAANWRGVLAQNQRKTVLVIITFLLIYTAIGLLVDFYIHGGFVPNQPTPVLYDLLTFHIKPMATITMILVAMVSIWITYALHDRIMLLGTEYHEVNDHTARTYEEKQLYNVIEELKIAAGMRYTPKVYVIEADYMNAFASGYSEKSAMVAVSRGLLEKLTREELAAVMAHELSHIRHGDIRLTLTVSILSNLMLIVVDVFFYSAIFSRGGSDNRRGDNRFLFIIILLRYLLPLITILLMLYLSRTREYMADAGSVELIRDNHPLARALLKISGDYDHNENRYGRQLSETAHEDVRRAAYIFDPFTDGFHPMKSLAAVFSTHPSIPDRLKALGFRTKDDV